MATDYNSSVKKALEKGSFYSFSFNRGKQAPIDSSSTWQDMNTMLTYCININDTYPCFEGQIVTVGKRAFVLKAVTGNVDYTSLWEFEAGSTSQTMKYSFTSGTHFYPIELVTDENGHIKTIEGCVTTVNGGVVLSIASLSTATINATGLIHTSGNVEAANIIASSGAVIGTDTKTTINGGTVTVTNEVKVGNTTNNTDIKDGNITTTGTVSAKKFEGEGMSFGENSEGNTELAVDIVMAKKLIAEVLEYDKTTYVGGRQITTVGGGAVIGSVTTTADGDYLCTLNLNEGDTTPFEVGDFVLCQTFGNNGGHAYWRQVKSKTDSTVTLYGGSTSGDGVNVSSILYDAPVAGDTIVHCGHVATDGSLKADRRVAIVISAVSTTEVAGTGIEPPYLAFYNSITTPDWPSQPNTVFSRTKNLITGEFKSAVSDTTTLNQKVSDINTYAQQLGVDMGVVKSQTDMAFTIWFADEAPCNSSGAPLSDKYPNTKFTDGYVNHVQDLCYVVSNTKGGSIAYRLVCVEGDGDNADTYKWDEISDKNILKALEDAWTAQQTANEAQETANDAKDAADEAQTAAENAQTAADNAKATAEAATGTLSRIADDQYITIQEFDDLQRTFDATTSSYNKLVEYAKLYGMDDSEHTSYTKYYNLTVWYGKVQTYYNAIKAVVQNETSPSDYHFTESGNTSRAYFSEVWSTYYEKEKVLYDAVVSAAKAATDKAQEDADKAQEDASHAISDISELNTAIGTMGSTINSNKSGITVLAGWFAKNEDGEPDYDKFISGSGLTMTATFAELFKTQFSPGGELYKAGIQLATETRVSGVEQKAALISGVVNDDGTIKGASVAAAINQQTGSTSVSIDADHIDIRGYLCGYGEGDDFVETWSISEDGKMTVNEAVIAGWSITEDCITSKTITANGDPLHATSNSQTNSYISLHSNGTIYCYQKKNNGAADTAALESYATSSWGFKYDGSGRLASGNITWNANGDATIKAKLIVEKESTIAGWTVGETTISKGAVSLGSDGSVSCSSGGTTKWLLGNNGDGQFANGKISWESNGSMTVGGAVIGDETIMLRNDKRTSGIGNVYTIQLSSKVNVDASNPSDEGRMNLFCSITNYTAPGTGTTTYPWTFRSDGTFSLGLGAVEWNGTKLTVKGEVYADKYYMLKKDASGNVVTENGKPVYVEIGSVSLTPTDDGSSNTAGNLTINNLTATNGKFSGELVAATGKFDGLIKASAIYYHKAVLSNQSGSVNINPATTNSCLIDASKLTNTQNIINLPKASDYNGLELTIIGDFTGTNTIVKAIYPQSGDKICYAKQYIAFDTMGAGGGSQGTTPRLTDASFVVGSDYEELCITFHHGVIKLVSDGEDRWIVTSGSEFINNKY